jgi:hypothetical protein
MDQDGERKESEVKDLGLIILWQIPILSEQDE